MTLVSVLMGGLLACASCGGGKKASTTGSSVGESHVADDLDVDDKGAATASDAGAATSTPGPDGTAPAAAVDAGATAAPASGALVTFRLKNTSTEELDFAIDKGWQGNIFAYTGVPPKAKSVMLFPKHCTAACSAAAEARCPYCPAPKRNRDEKNAEQRITVAPGAHHDVTWEGKIYKYKKTRGTRDGRRTRCKCYETSDIPKAEYTIKACGLRVTKKAGTRSRYECPTLKATLPPDAPTVITFEYPGK